MKIYRIEFTYFDEVAWFPCTKEIIAINKFQLIRNFLKETEYLKCYKVLGKLLTLWESQKELWKEIQIEEIQFPIVREL